MRLSFVYFGCFGFTTFVIMSCWPTAPAAVAAPGSGPATAPASDPSAVADAGAVADAATRFGFDLYARLRHTEGNLVVSPHGVSNALAFLYDGAGGRTSDELKAALRVPVDRQRLRGAARHLNAFLGDQVQADGKPRREPDRRPEARAQAKQEPRRTITTATSLWVDAAQALRQDFKAHVPRFYGGIVETVPFRDNPEAARERINHWLAGQTRGHFTDVADPASANAATRAFLANAIYLKAPWGDAFRKEETRDADFHLAPGKTVRVPMMRQTKMLDYYADNDVELAVMPYAWGPAYDKGAALSMVLLLPAKGRSLAQLEAGLDAAKVGRWLKGTQVDGARAERWGKRMAEVIGDEAAVEKWARESPFSDVTLELPRFRISSRIPLARPLEELGIKTLFGPQADLSGIGPGLAVPGGLIHAAFIAVDEAGTEAAAVTAGGLFGHEPLPGRPVTFRADRPFLFLIREETNGATLFIGRVVNPAA